MVQAAAPSFAKVPLWAKLLSIGVLVLVLVLRWYHINSVIVVVAAAVILVMMIYFILTQLHCQVFLFCFLTEDFEHQQH